MLLFLHGFLGEASDWEPVRNLLSHPSVALNLPGHGTAPVHTDIALSIHHQCPSARIIIGYSAGGRIALEMKERFPAYYKQVIAISAHTGLKTPEEKTQRLAWEKQWLKMLEEKPFPTFLAKWYDQPLFASLKESPHFSALFSRRCRQNSQHLAAFFRTYSLSQQMPPELSPNTIFLSGKKDLKYAELYRNLGQFLKWVEVENAGHAVPIENPDEVVKHIEGALL